MIHLACSVPRDIVLAVSGGPDSMALLDFCIRGKKNITVIHIDHGTFFAQQSREFVSNYCVNRNLKLDIYKVSSNINPTEESWRNFRLGVYKNYTMQGKTIATGHHLDDFVEWYLLTAIHGKANFMRPSDNEYGLIKPFLYTHKETLLQWCAKKSVPYLIDPTNIGGDNARAKLRMHVIPTLLQIHPGLKQSISNKARKGI